MLDVDSAILELRREGMTLDGIAKDVGLPRKMVDRRLRKMAEDGYDVPDPPEAVVVIRTMDRAQTIAEVMRLRGVGHSQQEIADRVALSRGAVSSIIWRELRRLEREAV